MARGMATYTVQAGETVVAKGKAIGLAEAKAVEPLELP